MRQTACASGILLQTLTTGYHMNTTTLHWLAKTCLAIGANK